MLIPTKEHTNNTLVALLSHQITPIPIGMDNQGHVKFYEEDEDPLFDMALATLSELYQLSQQDRPIPYHKDPANWLYMGEMA